MLGSPIVLGSAILVYSGHSLSVIIATLTSFSSVTCFVLLRDSNAGMTALTFSVNFDAAMTSQPCGSFSIESLFLQTNAALESSISTVVFAGVSAPYTFGPAASGGPSGLQVSLSGFGSVSPSTLLVVTLAGTFSASDVCDVPWYGAPACPYTFVGEAGSGCCPTGIISAP